LLLLAKEELVIAEGRFAFAICVLLIEIQQLAVAKEELPIEIQEMAFAR